MPPTNPARRFVIDGVHVRDHVGELAKNADLSKFIL